MSATQATGSGSTQYGDFAAVYRECKDHVHRISRNEQADALKKVRAEFVKIYGPHYDPDLHRSIWVAVPEKGRIEKYYVKRIGDPAPNGWIVDDDNLENLISTFYILHCIRTRRNASSQFF